MTLRNTGLYQNNLHAGVICISCSLSSCCVLGSPLARLYTSNLIVLAGSAPLRLGDYSHEAGEKHKIAQKQNNHKKKEKRKSTSGTRSQHHHGTNTAARRPTVQPPGRLPPQSLMEMRESLRSKLDLADNT